MQGDVIHSVLTNKPLIEDKGELRPRRRNYAVFISYHRDDSSYASANIHKELVRYYGADYIYLDIVDIAPGKDFKKEFSKAIKNCNVLLFIIGREWAKRVNSPDDYVRIELELALKKKIPLVPIFVDNMKMPNQSILPAPLKQLSNLNGLPVRPEPDFHNDIETLVSRLETNF